MVKKTNMRPGGVALVLFGTIKFSDMLLLLLVYGNTAAMALPRDDSSRCVSVTVFAVCSNNMNW